jgi:hypothetical protein
MLQASDLWVLPPSSHCSKFGQVDWYLNWQMTRGMTHKPLSVSPELKKIAQENDISTTIPALSNHAPLLIASEGLVPTGRVLVMPYNGEFKAWLEGIKDMTVQLSAKTAVIFLPAKVDAEKATKAWEKFAAGCKVQFIEDDEATA